jgi:hypothetical protein
LGISNAQLWADGELTIAPETLYERVASRKVDFSKKEAQSDFPPPLFLLYNTGRESAVL